MGIKCCLVQSAPDLHRGVSWVGKLLDNRDPGTRNEVILWANLILEGLGWVDESFFGGESSLASAAAAELGGLEGARDGRLLRWAEMKGAGYNPAKGQMSRDMKSSGKYLKNVNTKVEEELFSMLWDWN